MSKRHPLKDFALYFFGITFVVVITYIGLGLSVGIIVDSLSRETEIEVHNYLAKTIPLAKGEHDKNVERVFRKLVSHSDLQELYFKISVVDSKDENAMAYPGGVITVHSETLKNVKSENELAMILAHELGHYKHRHHLRGIGRALIGIIFSTSLSGSSVEGKGLTDFLLGTSDNSFSREGEEEADRFALDLLNKTYGHVKGFDGFFKRIDESEVDAIARFGTHPLSDMRVKNLREYGLKKGYAFEGELTKL